MTEFIVIPVKPFENAKTRLSPVLTNDERRVFCLSMLEDVLKTVASLTHKTIVIGKGSLPEIEKTFDVTFLKESGTGLNATVSEAIDWCMQRGGRSVLILPADIPLIKPADLNHIILKGKETPVVISPSRDNNGTNALLLTPPDVLPTFYGSSSFQRHLEEAAKQNLRFSICRLPRIALDIDTIEDLAHFMSLNAKETQAYRALEEIGLTQNLRLAR
jgi:2-phospho-L-lactate guanylyltransferase